MEQIPLDYGASDTLGDLLARFRLEASPAGITRLTVAGVRSDSPESSGSGQVGDLLRQAREELQEYLAGRRSFFSVPVDLSRLASFDRAALAAASEIPYGQVRTYQGIAERIGSPTAARAVGGAMAGNPIPILVPCHRVVRTDGGLGGYTFGLARKEALLSLERRTVPLVGCARSKILCRTGCEVERRISADGRVPFANLEDAAAAGYRPCAACRPG